MVITCSEIILVICLSCIFVVSCVVFFRFVSQLVILDHHLLSLGCSNWFILHCFSSVYFLNPVHLSSRLDTSFSIFRLNTSYELLYPRWCFLFSGLGNNLVSHFFDSGKKCLAQNLDPELIIYNKLCNQDNFSIN